MNNNKIRIKHNTNLADYTIVTVKYNKENEEFLKLLTEDLELKQNEYKKYNYKFRFNIQMQAIFIDYYINVTKEFFFFRSDYELEIFNIFKNSTIEYLKQGNTKIEDGEDEPWGKSRIWSEKVNNIKIWGKVNKLKYYLEFNNIKKNTIIFDYTIKLKKDL